MAKMAIYGHMTIGPCATNSGKWGIPEKNYKYKIMVAFLEFLSDAIKDANLCRLTQRN